MSESEPTTGCELITRVSDLVSSLMTTGDGLALGVAVGVSLGVAVGVGVDFADGVAVGFATGVGVGVALAG